MIKITPIGGLGEIGSNMVAWSDGESGFLVDCGILFPDEDVFELDYLIPSFDHLDPNFYKNIFITHAHEDHIGAISHVVKWNPSILIHATEFAKRMMIKRLNENKLQPKFKNLTKTPVKVNNWKIHAVDINHSAPETQCLVINHLKYSTSFCYASDFKINLKAVDGPAFKPAKVKKIMAPYSLRMGMLDSTNILNPSKTEDEGSLLKDLEAIISGEGRCFITFFTSNVRRLNNIVRLAKKHKRVLAVMGRSVWNTINVAVESEVAEFTKEDFSSVEDIQNREDEKLLVIVSGCQGDFRSALRRVAYREDPHIKLKIGDNFVFSSKVIPGNEDKISKIYNKLATQGTNIITAYDKLIHCSGHAAQKDLQLFIEGCDFTHYVPVHGETYFLFKHRDFVNKKFPKIKVTLLNNGEHLNIEYKAKNHKISTELNSEWKDPKLILGNMIEIERSQVSQRRKMASMGLVFITMGEKRHLWKCSFLGLPTLLEAKKEQILSGLFDHAQKEGKHKKPEELAELIRIRCRHLINVEIGQKPVCLVH